MYAKLTISFLFALCAFVLPQTADATKYYINFTCTTCTPNNGLSTTTAFTSLDAFAEAARSAGDIAFVRRGVASTTGVSDINFTSDGTIANPIIISADYDNLWSDFATSSQTYTVAAATSTLYASGAITGIAAGDWFYVEGDCFERASTTIPTSGGVNDCKFAYEVAAVSGTVLSLHIPYKGDQSGSGLSLRVMPDAPQWNIDAGSFQLNFDTDEYWYLKGLDLRGSDPNGVVEIDSSLAHQFDDMIIRSSTSEQPGFLYTDDGFTVKLNKVRTLNTGIFNNGGVDQFGFIEVKNSLADGNGAVSRSVSGPGPSQGFGFAYFADNFFRRNTNSDYSSFGHAPLLFRNQYFLSTTETSGVGYPSVNIKSEDHDGTVGRSKYADASAGTNTNIDLQISTSTVRSGGGPAAQEIRPTTNTTNIWDFNRIKLFEYPIYADTTSKQYDMYFKVATNTAEFTTDPTAAEFWIQCEYWAHNTGATSTRKVKKSTGVLDFNGSSAWQALSVTCQPTQSGIMYLSGYYAKPLESGGQTNIFLMDNTPVIQ